MVQAHGLAPHWGLLEGDCSRCCCQCLYLCGTATTIHVFLRTGVWRPVAGRRHGAAPCCSWCAGGSIPGVGWLAGRRWGLCVYNMCPGCETCAVYAVALFDGNQSLDAVRWRIPWSLRHRPAMCVSGVMCISILGVSNTPVYTHMPCLFIGGSGRTAGVGLAGVGVLGPSCSWAGRADGSGTGLQGRRPSLQRCRLPACWYMWWVVLRPLPADPFCCCTHVLHLCR